MSLEHEEQMVDRLSASASSSSEKLSSQEKELQILLDSKQKLMESQNKQYLEELFKTHSTTPINVKNVQITNSQSFRNGFLQQQLKPLLANNLVTLEAFFQNLDAVNANLVKLGVVERSMISLTQIPKTIFTQRKLHTVDIIPVFNVLPVKRFYAKTGTNIGNGEGDGYIQFQLKNLFGGAENLIFDAITGTKTQSSYLLNYNQPIFNNASYIFENLAHSNTRKHDWLGSEVKSRGLTHRIYTQFSSRVNHELILENTWRTLTNSNSRALSVLSQSGHDFKSSIIYNWKYDSRNNGHLPSSGSFLRLGAEYSGLWTFNSARFLKLVAEMLFSHQLNKLNFLIFTSKSGLLHNLSQNPSSVLDRFYIGGPNDVRSFALNGLGPKSYNSSVGGDYFLNGGVSLVSQIPRVSPQSNFKIHNFVNFGKLLPIDGSKGISELARDITREFSVSYGFGILYNHPMARFELNFVLPITVHERDSTRKGIQYGIGISFL